MLKQTVTHAAESESEPNQLLALLAKVEETPKWAPVFADSLERIDGTTRCRGTKSGKTFEIDHLVNTETGTVDFIIDMGEGKRGGAYIRVTPRPLGGSTITMNVPIGANATEEDVKKTLIGELDTLIRLAQS